MKNFWYVLAQLEKTLLISIMLAMPLLYGGSIILSNLVPALASHLGWVEELTRFLMAWLAFLGVGYALDTGRHVSMDLGHHMIPASALVSVRRVIDAVGACFSFYAAYLGWDFVGRIIATGQVSNTLGVSMAWLYAALPVGMVLIGIRFLRYLITPARRADDEVKVSSESST